MSKVYTAKDIEYLQILAQDCLSLNEKVADFDSGYQDAELQDFIMDTSPGPEELAITNDTNATLLSLVDDLKPRLAIVLKMRYGFTTGAPMTLAEVGNYFGVTRERIRQVEAVAIRQLKKRIKRQGDFL